MVSRDSLTWQPPTGYANFPVRNVPAAPNSQTLLKGSGDVVLKMPDVVTGPIIIDGYRNVVVIGGSIKALPVSQIDGIDQRLIYVRNCTGTVHLEGLLLDGGTPGAETDAITANGNSTILQVQNVRVEGLDGLQATNHADVIQTWLGLKELRVDGLTGYSDYQGIKFQLTNTFVMDKVTIRRTNLRAIGTDARYLLWFDPKSTFPIVFDDVYVAPYGSRTLGLSVWPGDPSSSGVKASISNDVATWPTKPNVTGSVRKGVPANGDFVKASEVGLNYGSTAPATAPEPEPEPVLTLSGLEISYDAATRQATLWWATPRTGDVALSRNDSTDLFGTTTQPASLGTYMFGPHRTSATWVELTIAVGDVSVTGRFPTGTSFARRVVEMTPPPPPPLPPVPGDLDGDRDVDLDDLRLLSASRPDDVELATIVNAL